MKCITCSQPLPENLEEHPGYFARYSLEPDEDDPQDFTCEVDTLLHYIQSLSWALVTDEKNLEENDLHWIHQLIEDLSAEALRRLGLANDALDRRYERDHGQDEKQATPSGNGEQTWRAPAEKEG